MEVPFTLTFMLKNSTKGNIKNDFKLLKNLDFESPKPSEELLKHFELKQLTDQSLSAWIGERVQFAVGEKHSRRYKFDFHSDEYEFSHPELAKIEDYNFDINNSSRRPIPIMSNLSASLYLAGKSTGRIYKAEIPTSLFKKVEVILDSPRKGIISMNRHAFSKDFQISPRENSIADAINRLTVFAHEARHSDGAGIHQSFFHARCPKGHMYAGRLACDRNLNGPYFLQTLLYRDLIKRCISCKTEEKEALKLRMLDSISRVITETPNQEIDNSILDHLENLELTLSIKMLMAVDPVVIAETQQELKNVADKIKEEKLRINSVIMIQSTNWPSKPERATIKE